MGRIALVHFNHSQTDRLTVWPDMRTSAWKPNYGDMLVCAAIVKQIGLRKDSSFTRVAFGNEVGGDVDLAVVRGSTYLHDQFDFASANRTLDSIRSPLAVVGLGAQNPTRDVGFLDGNAGARAFIARISEKSRSISARGRFSAAVIERLGGRNIRLTGCPSLFYSLKLPHVAVPEMLDFPERRIGVSIHTGLSNNMYCRSPGRARHMHARVIDHAARNSINTVLFEQGVMQEYDVADRTLPFAARVESAAKIIRILGAEGTIAPRQLIGRMVSVKSIEEWLAKARDLDAIVGFRFHGNMVALLQGAPCYYYTYDSRLDEFCDIYKLPYQDVCEDWKDPIGIMRTFDWDSTNRAMAACYDELLAFYAENAVPCVMARQADGMIPIGQAVDPAA